MNTKYALPMVLAGSVMLSGCWLDDDDDPVVQEEPTSSVRVLHASPDAPAVDVAIDGEVVLTGVEFQQGTGYLSVPAGSREVSILAGGDVVLTETYDVEEGSSYSIIAQDNVASLQLELLDDTERRNNGTADVTVVHASPSAGDVDVYVELYGQRNDPLPQTPVLSDVVFDTNATLLDQDAGDYRVRLTAANDTEVVYDSGSLGVGADVTVVAVDSTKGISPASLLAWTESEPAVAVVLDDSAEVRIVHAVDEATVDVFVGGVELLSGFTYTTVEPHTVVAPGELDVAIAPSGQGIGNAIESLSDTLTLERGESYTVIAAGDESNLTGTRLIVLVDERQFDTSDQAKVRLVHGASAPAADPVDIFLEEEGVAASGDPDFPDVTFGQDTGYVTVGGAASYNVVIAADGTTSPAVPGTDRLTLGVGGIVTAIAVGDSAPNLEAIVMDDLRP